MSDHTTMERPMVGDVIVDKYRIEGIAGEGGMGIVYEAEHVILRRRVAIKVLLPGTVTSPEILERFSIEARALASIKSDHVVHVVDAGSLKNGAPYLVMEYLDGCDLGALLSRRGVLEPEEVVDYSLQALEALANAHAAGIIHRDLKPGNLFLVERGSERPILKLLDFGVSKSVESNEDSKLTGPRILGSLAYMSPEQLRKEPLDRRTDLWSLGVVMYELLAGALPFVGEFGDLITAILQSDPAPLHERRPAISKELATVIAKCLERNVAARWTNAGEVARALAPHGTGAWAALVPRITEVVSQPSRVRRQQRQYPSYDNALQALETATVIAPERPDGAKARRTPTKRPTAEVTTLRILLIDDSQISLAVHDRLLETAGFEVRTIMSPGEIEAVLSGWAPHLVLMDVEMPGVKGDVLCRQIKARLGSSVPVVLVSDLPRDVLAAHALAGGADAFISKMSDGHAFVEYVRNICAIAYSPESLP
jgi:serine/threonine protein kinase